MKIRYLIVALLFLATIPIVSAATIWDNGGPDFTDAIGSDFDVFPVSQTGAQAGDDFTLGATSTVNQIQWWGVYGPNNTPTQPDSFTIRFFNIVAGVPAITPFASYSIGEVAGIDTGSNLTAVDLDVYSFTAVIPATFLAPGSYLLSIVNNTAADADDNWFWAFSNFASGNSKFRFNDGEGWIPSDFGELAFNISGNGGAVPEAGSTALLLGCAVAAIMFAHRRLRFS